MNIRTRRIRIGKETMKLTITQDGDKFYRGSFASSEDMSTELVVNQRYTKEVVFLFNILSLSTKFYIFLSTIQKLKSCRYHPIVKLK